MLCRLINLQLLPNVNIDLGNNVKYVLKPNWLNFTYSIDQGIDLQLIHTDIYDLKSVQIRGEENISLLLLLIVQEIAMYLLRSKDKSIKIFIQYKSEVEN